MFDVANVTGIDIGNSLDCIESNCSHAAPVIVVLALDDIHPGQTLIPKIDQHTACRAAVRVYTCPNAIDVCLCDRGNDKQVDDQSILILHDEVRAVF